MPDISGIIRVFMHGFQPIKRNAEYKLLAPIGSQMSGTSLGSRLLPIVMFISFGTQVNDNHFDKEQRLIHA
jgi:hypothetical protein